MNYIDMKRQVFRLKIYPLTSLHLSAMRLYYFTSKEYGLLAIKNCRLKIARINELNDPFEFIGCNVQDPKLRAKLRLWKKNRHSEIGILCFSNKWSSPLLWGHYADKHRGMALGFDVPDDGSWKQVIYVPNRRPFLTGSELDCADTKSLLLTKFDAWQYESEFRYFCHLDEGNQRNGLYFEPFSVTLKLVEVIVGSESRITRNELSEALCGQHPNVSSFKARPAFGAFMVIENRNKAHWK
tara:strand:+ start:1784 stop:2503 length:720 start_codon:yes stop_codon:yes gene_type:complete